MNKVQGGLRRTFPKIFFLREKSCESWGGCNKIWLAIAHGLSDSHQALLLLPPPVCCWVYTSDPVGWVGGWWSYVPTEHCFFKAVMLICEPK